MKLIAIQLETQSQHHQIRYEGMKSSYESRIKDMKDQFETELEKISEEKTSKAILLEKKLKSKEDQLNDLKKNFESLKLTKEKPIERVEKVKTVEKNGTKTKNQDKKIANLQSKLQKTSTELEEEKQLNVRLVENDKLRKEKINTIIQHYEKILSEKTATYKTALNEKEEQFTSMKEELSKEIKTLREDCQYYINHIEYGGKIKSQLTGLDEATTIHIHDRNKQKHF